MSLLNDIFGLAAVAMTLPMVVALGFVILADDDRWERALSVSTFLVIAFCGCLSICLIIELATGA